MIDRILLDRQRAIGKAFMRGVGAMRLVASAHVLTVTARSVLRKISSTRAADRITFVLPDQRQAQRFVGMFRHTFGLSEKEVEDRYHSACHPVIALYDGAPVAQLWIAFGQHRLAPLGHTLKLRAYEFATFDGYTIPAFRGLGIGTRLHDEAHFYATAAGRHRHIMWHAPWDAAQRRMARRLGHEAVAQGHAAWLLGRRVLSHIELKAPGVCVLSDDLAA